MHSRYMLVVGMEMSFLIIMLCVIGLVLSQRKVFLCRLTSSLRHPKIFIKEFGDFLMPCHQHCLSVYILVQR